MIILGITGAIGHGKTTFSEYLTNLPRNAQHFESSDLIIKVANELRRSSGSAPQSLTVETLNSWLAPLSSIVSVQLNAVVDPSQLLIQQAEVENDPKQFESLFRFISQQRTHPAGSQELILDANKFQYRSLLQWLGGFIVHRCGGLWYQEIVRQIVATPDLDAAIVGGLRFPDDANCLRHEGGQILHIIRPQMRELQASDVTEQYRTAIEINATVINDGSLLQLQACAAAVYQDALRGKLQEVYQASEMLA